MRISELRKNLLSGKMTVEGLLDYKDELNHYHSGFLKKKVLSQDQFDEVRELIMLYLDYYTYSEDGDVLISDHDYDELMTHYVENGGSLISRADKLEMQSQWEFIKHEEPGMVGSIKKIYTYEELYTYMMKWKPFHGKRTWIVAPKFDGISSAIKVNSNGVILTGVTRNDGIEGQDITKVIRQTYNGKTIASFYGDLAKSDEYIWIKTELVMETDNFNALQEEKKYRNRRSATSGIVNSPKNLEYAKYITVIPLAVRLPNGKIAYAPIDSEEISTNDPNEMMKNIEDILSVIRDSSYPYRTDGVIIYPIGEDVQINYDDIMDNAIAYKVNTEEALTKVEYGYVSVGRMGYGIPMLKVSPVEVNETTVEDVSLGSFDKFVNMDLHEGEQVLVYSAGDVIPQAKIPEIRHFKENAKLLKIKKRCPYCNEKLERVGAGGQYRCTNSSCFRILSGKVTNFLVKLGADGISDRTVEDLMNAGLIKDIPDVFNLTVEQISPLQDYGEESAKLIVNEIHKIRDKPIETSVLLGSLGITGISKKKCKNLVDVIPLKKMLKMKKNALEWELYDAENTGEKTAKLFAEFISENKDMIQFLVDTMNIVRDVQYKGNVVFTGFRDSDLERQFNDLGYEISSSVTNSTVAVIDASYTHESTKCKEARKKGISIEHKSNVGLVLKGLGNK